ncbi:MAG: insulinase family protein [Armatimonadetes bacterium]|nr:insulinase family protein [Armatimonadota bacterium]
MSAITAATVTQTMLDNGLTLLVKPAPGVGAVAIHGYVKAAAVFDAGRPGHARFVGSTLIHGTRRRTAWQIADALDAIGASLIVAPGLEVTSVTARALADDLPALLDIQGEVLQEPAFPPDEVEKVRGQLITSVRVNALDTRYVAERLFRQLAYPDGHPHQQPPDGDETVLARLGADDLRTFHARYFRPEATLFAVVGDLDASRVIDLVVERFGNWPSAGAWSWPAFAAPAAGEAPRRVEQVVPGKSQADLVLGAPGIGRSDPDYYATMMANLLLGQLGMYGRIGENVRERQGMAYYAFSDLRAGLLAGPWWVRAGVNPTNLDRAVAAIVEEIRRLQREGPIPDELADARRFLIGSLAVRQETTQGMAQLLADIELFGLGLDYLERYPSIIEGISHDQIVAAVRRFPLEAYALAIATPERAG